MRKLLFLTAILLNSYSLFGQEQVLDILICSQTLSGENVELDDPEVISELDEQLRTTLEGNFRHYNLNPIPYNNRDLELSAVLTWAQQQEIPLICYGLIMVQERRALVQLSLYDSATGQLIGSDKGFGRWASISFFNSLEDAFQGLWDSRDQEIIQLIMEDPDYDEKRRPVRIFLSSQNPGTEIYFQGEEFLGTTGETPLELPFHPYPLGQELILTLKKPGHYTIEDSIVLDQSVIDHRLPNLIPATSHGLLLRHNYYQFYGAGLGYRYYLKDDSIFLNGSYYFSMTPPNDSYSSSATHHDLSIEAGYYPFFSKSYHIFRYGVVMGAGAIFSTVGPDGDLYFDPYLNWLTLFAELNMSRFSLAMRMENRFNFGLDNSLLPRGAMEVKVPKENSNEHEDPYNSIPLMGLELLWKL